MGQYDYKLSFLLRENVRSALPEDIVQPPKKTERVLLHFGPTEEEREKTENAGSALDDDKAKEEKEKNLKKILKRLEKQGFETTSRLGDIAAGNIALEDIERMALHPNVISIESTQVLNTELDESARDIGLEEVRTRLGNSMCKGKGVIVAVIDSGFDVMHPCFRDAKGKTRIISFWDQNQKIEDIEIDPAQSKLSYKSPKPFNYGVNYTSRHINRAIEIETELVSAHLGEINEAVQQAKDASGHIDAEKEKEIRTKKEKELRAKALKESEKIVPRNFKDCSHGTHVAAIAAGSGVSTKIAAEDGTALVNRETPFLGMAPEADLILVSYRNKQNRRLGGSAFVVDAIKYILDIAKSKDKAVVINFSQGSNIGSHDGKSLLEQAIDNILDRKGVAFVNSAGNACGDATHFRDKMVHKGTCVIKLKIDERKDDIGDDTIDIWYGPQDRFDVAVASPPKPDEAQPNSLLQTPKIMPASTVTFRLGNGNDVHVRSRLDDAENHANRIVVILKRGERHRIEPGEWSIILTGREVRDGVFHAWIDNTKDEPFPTFVTPKDDFTITIPGTSKKVITVGAHYSRSPTQKQWGEDNPKPLPEIGDVVEFSSLGPIVEIKKVNDKLFMSVSEVTKPELLAPGAMVISAFDSTKGKDRDGYGLLAGTSMSAPHVAGIIALLFEKNKYLTQDDIRNILVPKLKPKDLKTELGTEPPAPPAQEKQIVKLTVNKLLGEELEKGYEN